MTTGCRIGGEVQRVTTRSEGSSPTTPTPSRKRQLRAIIRRADRKIMALDRIIRLWKIGRIDPIREIRERAARDAVRHKARLELKRYHTEHREGTTQ